MGLGRMYYWDQNGKVAKAKIEKRKMEKRKMERRKIENRKMEKNRTVKIWENQTWKKSENQSRRIKVEESKSEDQSRRIKAQVEFHAQKHMGIFFVQKPRKTFKGYCSSPDFADKKSFILSS